MCLTPILCLICGALWVQHLYDRGKTESLGIIVLRSLICYGMPSSISQVAVCFCLDELLSQRMNVGLLLGKRDVCAIIVFALDPAIYVYGPLVGDIKGSCLVKDEC